MTRPPQYWFPAKRYGWGWGPPQTWQGWVVVGVYAAVIVAVMFRFPPRAELVRFELCLLGATVALIGICWAKGEPPRWRWGGK